MKKYIEVFNTCEKLRRRLDELKTIVPPANYGEVVHSATLIIKFLQEQQPADVVEVVRCKDCRYRFKNKWFCCDCRCLDDDNFCNYGKRGEDAKAVNTKN